MKSNTNATKNAQSNDDEKNQKTQNHHIVKIQSLKFEFNDIDEKYLEETKQIYHTQCPSIKHQLEQRSLFILLSWQRLYQYPLMLYIYDCFHRDKLRYYRKTKKDITFDDWALHFHTLNNLLQYIEKEEKEKKIKNIIVHGVETYAKRYCLPLQLSSCTYIIRDSIEHFVTYIQEINGLINSVIHNPIEVLPFQIDLLIIPHCVVDIHRMKAEEEALDTDNDNDSDFDDDSDDSDTESVTKPQQSKPQVDLHGIGDIENNLKRYKGDGILYHKETYTGNMERKIRVLYKEYQKKVYHERKMMNNDDEKVQSAPPNLNPVRTVSMDKYWCSVDRVPHRMRLCVVVDRRKAETDDVYMFQAPLWSEIPSDHMYEWYIESSAQGLMPDEVQNMITAKTVMNGMINVFSFHAEAEDNIRCYLYRMGQILRFMPCDILNLFPYLFDLKKYDNEKYLKQLRDDIKFLDRCKWKDSRFDEFRKALSKKRSK